MTSLKPCPYCGSSDVWLGEEEDHRGMDAWTVRCQSCGVEHGVPAFEPKKAAVERWNRRAHPTCGTCRHWNNPQPSNGPTFGQCHGIGNDSVVIIEGSSDWNVNDEAWLDTPESFYCALHEPKANE